jgi:uncharacterized C2H2 Zn-finger protein
MGKGEQQMPWIEKDGGRILYCDTCDVAFTDRPTKHRDWEIMSFAFSKHWSVGTREAGKITAQCPKCGGLENFPIWTPIPWPYDSEKRARLDWKHPTKGGLK